MISKFTDLEAWKEVHKLTLLIYRISKNFPREEMYGLTSQIRRAAISIESCIAEGFCRYHYKERLNFYYDARGSIGEAESQSLTAKDLQYMRQPDFEQIFTQAEKVNVILGGLIRSTENLSKR
jgi:four helix bundle protein